MAIRDTFFSYLTHFRRTVPVRDLVSRPHERNLIALRHDVDYDLDLALELAYHEHQAGFAASYFLLHTAPYWQDSRLILKCLQLQDFGHEVGLHLNLLKEWFDGQTESPQERLRELLDPLRQAGVDVRGAAAHGDRLCYERGFNNSWCFRELRGDHPEASHHLRTAEGPPTKDPRFQIAYPPDHRLVRQDGAVFDLWSMSLAGEGLTYHAYHAPHDRYFSDSGGSWQRSVDPLTEDLSTGRVQILMHPIYWRGPQRLYLFLSAARSGSLWLANFLDRGTSVTARHEFLLNHRLQEGQVLAEKRTGDGFTDLLDDPATARQLLVEGRALLEDSEGDQAEVNVYLERFLPLLEEVFPDAVLVHLHRNPWDVVRSILNRDWYDTPHDSRHAAEAVENWDQLSQLERACWYVRGVNERLLAAVRERLRFETMVGDLEGLIGRLRNLGIAVYPRLARDEHGKRLNANTSELLPLSAQWPLGMQGTVKEILSPIGQRLGYTGRFGSWLQGLKALLSRKGVAEALQEVQLVASGRSPQELSVVEFQDAEPDSLAVQGCRLEKGPVGIDVVPTGDSHAHVLFGGGSWRELSPQEGWQAQIACYFRGVLGLTLEGSGQATLFCLMYDEAGALVRKRVLGSASPEKEGIEFSFRVRSDLARFNLALYMPVNALPARIGLRGFRLARVPLEPPRWSDLGRRKKIRWGFGPERKILDESTDLRRARRGPPSD
jgi:hypothetical protein